MLNTRSERQCFIIGPMKDDRLKRLAKHVVEPLFEQIKKDDGTQYTVRTPFDLGGNHIMNDVIYAIDRADIVIADLTGSNPNVFYELGICHALGRPCITVMEESQKGTEFDIRAYRYYKVNLDANDELFYHRAKETLRDPLRKAHKDADWARFENPVIDFFRAPITYISPAFSLAQGYYTNFIRPVVESIIKKKGGSRYIYDIGIGVDTKQHPNKMEESQVLAADIRSKLELHIVIPEKITYTQRNYVDKMRDQILSAIVETDGRPMSCFYRPYDNEMRHSLVDIPTTVRSMRDAVERRMRHPNASDSDPEWQEIELQEIERFILSLQLLIDRHESNPEFKDRIHIHRYNPDNPNNLLWMHNILVGE